LSNICGVFRKRKRKKTSQWAKSDLQRYCHLGHQGDIPYKREQNFENGKKEHQGEGGGDVSSINKGKKKGGVGAEEAETNPPQLAARHGQHKDGQKKFLQKGEINQGST